MPGAIAVVLGMVVPILTLSGVTVVHAAAVDGQCGHPTTLAGLCVESSSNGSATHPYDFGIVKGQKVTPFKWLLNEDDSTGDPSFTAANVANCLPTRAGVDATTAAANPALAIYQGAGSGSLADCPWPSVHASAGHSTVLSSGDDTDVSASLAKLAAIPGDHKYLLSVTAGGYKIDGIHFAVSGGVLATVNEEPVGNPGAKFVVKVNPLPKKTATVRIHVYNDNASTNGQWDGQTETLVTCADATPQQVAANCGGSTDPNLVGDPSTDMSGFSVSISDVLAQTTTDVYGSPLCTQYETDAQGNVLLNDDGTPNALKFGDVVTNTDGTTSPNPISSGGGASGGALAGTDSTCISDHYGDIVIPNMGPNRYAATVIPPDPRTHNGDQWVQTTTLEGGHDWDTWNIEGGTGYDTELIVGGERVSPVAHGFVKLTHPDQVWNDAETQAIAARNANPLAATPLEDAYYNASGGFTGGAVGNGVLTGTIAIGRAYIGSGGSTPLAGTNLANAKKDGVIDDGLVSISCLATCNAPTDTTVWTGRARADGTFAVNHLQTGDYSVAFWDEAQSYILAVMQYHVTSTPTFTITAANLVPATRNAPLRYALTFAANSGLAAGDTITLTGGTQGWSGEFTVTNVNPAGTIVRVAPIAPTPNPTGTATTTMPSLNFINSATVQAGVPTVSFGVNPFLAVGGTVYFSSAGNSSWTGNFQVLTLSPNGRTATFAKVDPTAPAATGTVTDLSMNVTSVSDILLPGWFTDLQGTVFNDLNGDGVHDANEPGIPDFVLSERTRGNSVQDQGASVAVTNDKGEYDLSQGYPLGQFLIAEAYNPRYKNTGYTYKADNDPTSHTVLSAQVDINFLPIIGLSAKLDWGVQAYGTGQTDYWGRGLTNPADFKDENGAIVGTVSYDVTRNEFDPAYSAQEDYQPGVSGISMQLWKTHKTDGIHPDKYSSGAVQQWGVSPTADANGSFDCMRQDTDRGTNAVLTTNKTLVSDGGRTCRPFDYYVTESWARPVGCKALDVNGNHLAGEMAMPDSPDTVGAKDSAGITIPATPVDYSHNPDNLTASSTSLQSADCIETPMNGFQIGGNGTVDGNYALTSLMRPTTLDGTTSGTDLEALYGASQNNFANSDPIQSGNDYVVEAVNPVDTINAKKINDVTAPTYGGYVAADGSVDKRLYKFTDETAINVMSGDTYVPQGGFSQKNPKADGGGYNLTVDPATSPIRQDNNSLGAGTVAKCAGTEWTVPEITAPLSGLGQDAVNPDLNGAGGNPYGGRTVPVCDAKVVTVAGGRSMPAGFFVYAEVPIPSKFYGLVNDDLNVNVDRRSVLLGEVAPASNVPVGIYDENGNWKMTAHSDVNGFYEALLPSIDTYNCPLPAGPCANMYRLVGNDPGTLAHKNLDYNPQFRTIATEFQAWPGVVHPVDQAPTHQGITIEGPAAQFGALSLCAVNQPDTAADKTTPVLFAISKPYYNPSGDSTRQYVVNGSGFGGVGTGGSLKLGNTAVTTTSWTDTQIKFSVPSTVAAVPGPYQLSITNGLSHLTTVNGLTFHVLGTGYLSQSDVYEVSPLTDPTIAESTANVPFTNDADQHFTPIHDAWDAATNTPAGFATPRNADGSPPAVGLDVNGVIVGDSRDTSASSPNGRAIQRAVQAAYNASNNGNNPKLVVIYPNVAGNYAPHNTNAAYFENVVLHGKVKLQGVGPGGATSTTNIVHGTSIDASQFWSATAVVPAGGNQQVADGTYSDDWRTFANGIARDGVGPVDLPEGEGVLAIAEANRGHDQVAAALNGRFTPGVDGVLMTGGDQQGNPGNINTAPGAIGDTVPGPTAPGPSQGGAIMLDQYVRDFNITNDQIQSNGGTYGTIRIGTPDLPNSPNTTGVDESLNHNERLVVANNRIVANGGTNLAGALGIFAGADNYKVTGNDFCGNFSAEYGGAISHYGASPGGNISKNRIYYNQGYDEGGGIMIAGALPANNNALSPGAGAVVGNVRTGVTIDSNLLVSNQSNDDGGGIRFLMAGDFPFNVTNNIIANNLSTHEGGGIALDDAPNVRLVNNTIVKNVTTATAATNGALASGIKPANPAGLSTGPNSSLLQAQLNSRYVSPPTYSNPAMFNNIFWDNRAGFAQLPIAQNFNQSAIYGIGGPGDTTPIQHWDMGVVGCATVCKLTPTNSVLNSPVTLPLHATSADTYTASPTNKVDQDPLFVNPQDFLVDSLMWRNNTNTSFPVIVAHMLPVSLLADYHLTVPVTGPPTSPAYNGGAANKPLPGYQQPPAVNLAAPDHDVDSQARPQSGGFDIGADEIPGRSSDLRITKTDGQAVVTAGSTVTYTITVTNDGPDAVTGATVTDALVAPLSGTGLNQTINLGVGASQTFTVSATLAGAAAGSVSNTATVAVPTGTVDGNLVNNSSTDTDTITIPRPALGTLDTFNRPNANTLGANWSQLTLGGAAIRVVDTTPGNTTTGVANANFPGNAVWNAPAGGFGPKQGAAFTISNTTVNGDALILKASGGSAAVPTTFIRVRLTATQVVVETTANGGFTSTNLATFASAFANGNTLTAVANADGSVDVWSGTTYVGRSATSSFTGGGRIGIQMPTNARVDNFAGGTL